MLRSIWAQDPARAAAALSGLRRYQEATRVMPPFEPPVLARAGRARLLDYRPAGGLPLVVVPSLVNGWQVLDLSAERSMLRWLAGQGIRPLLVDWATPSPDERELSIGGHVEELLLPLLAAAPAGYALLGYCLGGTMALAAAAIARPAALALLATPWRFSGYSEEAREGVGAMWSAARSSVGALGLLPAEVLQAGFWQLDAERTVGKFAALDGADEATLARFVAVEDWANSGPPLTLAAGQELACDLFGADRTGAGDWQVGERLIDPAALACPVLDVVSTTDRIVPAAASAGIGTRLELAQGHVGMVVGSRAAEALWRPLADWLRAVR